MVAISSRPMEVERSPISKPDPGRRISVQSLPGGSIRVEVGPVGVAGLLGVPPGRVKPVVIFGVACAALPVIGFAAYAVATRNALAVVMTALAVFGIGPLAAILVVSVGRYAATLRTVIHAGPSGIVLEKFSAPGNCDRTDGRSSGSQKYKSVGASRATDTRSNSSTSKG